MFQCDICFMFVNFLRKVEILHLSMTQIIVLSVNFNF